MKSSLSLILLPLRFWGRGGAFLFLLILFINFVCPAEDSDKLTTVDKAFFQQIQKAVLNDDFEWFSSVVSYPIDLQHQKRKFHVKTKEQLKRHTAFIFSSHNKKVIQSQTPETLFKNWQGLMIGNGEFWYSEIRQKSKKNGPLTWVYRITAINDLPDDAR